MPAFLAEFVLFIHILLAARAVRQRDNHLAAALIAEFLGILAATPALAHLGNAAPIRRKRGEHERGGLGLASELPEPPASAFDVSPSSTVPV